MGLVGTLDNLNLCMIVVPSPCDEAILVAADRDHDRPIAGRVLRLAQHAVTLDLQQAIVFPAPVGVSYAVLHKVERIVGLEVRPGDSYDVPGLDLDSVLVQHDFVLLFVWWCSLRELLYYYFTSL